MSMIPDSLPSALTRLSWDHIPNDLVGLVVSLDKLKELFPAKDGYTTPEFLESKGTYDIYAQKPTSPKSGWAIKVAYKCGGCKEIVVGQPLIRDDTSIELNIPLAGRRGYDIYCRNCHHLLEDVTLEIS